MFRKDMCRWFREESGEVDKWLSRCSGRELGSRMWKRSWKA